MYNRPNQNSKVMKDGKLHVNFPANQCLVPWRTVFFSIPGVTSSPSRVHQEVTSGLGIHRKTAFVCKQLVLISDVVGESCYRQVVLLQEFVSPGVKPAQDQVVIIPGWWGGSLSSLRPKFMAMIKCVKSIAMKLQNRIIFGATLRSRKQRVIGSNANEVSENQE
ncbi:hypothetical protein BU23DRAFT_655649 [Bimuria novae-zelandiae CBS 107.79]|uniref:Uncharacterized protein n=1 Tax=Bimuria novae-zelandiae CBS 107.79 TaxID=1447943 RepID=A0A6A5UXV7_9PLEO|nr:hypothetical protein BU23DRAFT_655649 [Bimuria novae-zelandiae CBS 107.79]